MSDNEDLNNLILDNINVRVSALEYKLDGCDQRITDLRQDLIEARDERRTMHKSLDKIEEKVLKNGKTKASDWVQIVLLVAITVIGIIFGV